MSVAAEETSNSGRTIVVGIDPGLRATGFAVLEVVNGELKLHHLGEVKSSAKRPLQERLESIFAELEAILGQWKPRMMALEKLYSAYSFPYTAVVMGHVRGVLCLAAQRAGMEVTEVAPTEAKKALTGYGRASKQQVSVAIGRLLGLKEPPDSEHIADALALAVVGALRLDSSAPSQAKK
ncbi:MAG: Holliday junction resolvase [Armatimonadetes bacterium]|nr:Holliday junction resolvase [Armatimonadota bacterium]NIM23422.1 Holliday junction resolvase [Armatimonadota bacterium]NIM67287.1 Holliday junction resolvase [Armatimonadota bacterium]NIM75785.1 Holliday junction resolvase [Armatimonadota bacterium]NIN05473.1 Holliday junction resolvase [Armatimonadota bacterium]